MADVIDIKSKNGFKMTAKDHIDKVLKKVELLNKTEQINAVHVILNYKDGKTTAMHSGEFDPANLYMFLDFMKSKIISGAME